MTINRILLFGSTGMLGNYIKVYFKDTIEIIDIKFRITKESLEELENILNPYNLNENSCVINCIGQIPQRMDEYSSNSLYFIVNSLFPHLLWSICKKNGSKMIQPTTDCVFSGKKADGGYIETDLYDEEGLYGLSKSLGEPLGCTIIRTSIIGLEKYNKKSFLEWVLLNIKEDLTFNGYSNHYWNGITCLEYCNLISQIITNDLFWVGVRHIKSPKSYSKFELCLMIVDVFDKEFNKEKIIEIKTSHIVNKTLNTLYAENIYIPDLSIQIKRLINFDIY